MFIAPSSAPSPTPTHSLPTLPIILVHEHHPALEFGYITTQSIHITHDPHGPMEVGSAMELVFVL